MLNRGLGAAVNRLSESSQHGAERLRTARMALQQSVDIIGMCHAASQRSLPAKQHQRSNSRP